MARLYSNENFPLQVVLALRAYGHDVLTTIEAGRANQEIPDEEVLTFASQEKRIVLTLNRRHFIRLHQHQSNHAGIIICTQDSDTNRQADQIHTALAQISDLSGKLIRINLPQK